MRLDKLLSTVGYGSRKEVKKIINNGSVTVNNNTVRQPKYKIDQTKDTIQVNGQIVKYQETVYIMMNKPSGYECSSSPDFYPSVLDLIKEYREDLIIAGRLDVDTEGLLLITNDGIFSHNIMHGKKKVPKTYYVELKSKFDIKYIEDLESGIELDDGPISPSIVRIIDEDIIQLTIFEGRFHQVKRMMHYCNNEVSYLKRIKIGNYELDPTLKPGEYMYLNIK